MVGQGGVVFGGVITGGCGDHFLIGEYFIMW